MPLGAARLNTLSKVLTVAADPRTSDSVVITVAGDAQISTSQNKIGGASIRLGANGDIIQPTSRTDLGDILNDGDYTIEAYVRHDSVASVDYIFSNRKTTFGAFGWVLTMRGDQAGDPFQFLTSGYTGITGTANIDHQNGASANTWYHVAVVRSGNTITLFVDGVASNDTIDLSGSSYAASNQLWFGSNGNTAAQMIGYMDEIRVSNVARYTSNFTPSTTAFEPDANTLLLIHGDGTNGDTAIGDDPSVRSLDSMSITLAGDTQISTTQSQFGGSSVYMDGTGDYMDIQDVATNNLDFGTDNFTIEWWQYLTSLDRFAIDMRDGSNGAKILLYSYPTDGSADDLYLWVNSANRITASNCLSANSWQHIVLQREDGTTRLFVDGSQVGSDYSDSTNYAHDEILIWENSLSSGNYTPPGYVDEFRITKGRARYPGTSYTVPTSAFAPDVGTALLIHGDGTNNDTLITDDPSAVLTGLDTDNSYYLHTSSYSNSESNTSNLTVSFWIKTDDSSTSGERYLFQFGSSNDQTFFLYNQGTGGGQVGTNGFIRVGNLDGGWKYDRLFDCGSINGDGNWHHIVYSRSGTSDQAYVDGVSKSPFTNSFNSYNNTGNHEFGSYSTASILAGSTGGASKIIMPVCQVFIDNTYIDLSQSSNRQKFYNTGGVDMGTDGTSSSLSQPLHFFHGKTTEFNSDGGRAGQSFTQAGTGSNTNGPALG